MLVVPLVSKSSVCVIRLSQQGEVSTSGISLPFIQSNSFRSVSYLISSPLRNWVSLLYQELYVVLSAAH